MPIKLSREGQSIFDIVAENFGTLDNLIDVVKDNQISLSGNLQVNTEIVINNEGLGNADIKKSILNQKLEFNNKYVSDSDLTVDSTLITADNNTITVDSTTEEGAQAGNPTVFVPVPNAGADGTTDWDDNTTPGVGDNWAFNGNGAASKVTGNGFVGDAQRFTKVGGSSAVLTSDLFSITSGVEYSFLFKYRLSEVNLSNSVIIRDSLNNNIANINITPVNIGNATLFESSSFLINVAQIKVLFVISNSSTDNTYLEIDDVKLRKV